ncbi:MAG TPA: M20/M25/M40 family metallo-hydrolase [Gemmatimonadaceae bacterium]|nr:M20/M25/M40 family metallo-hydrolase [Gemmatimonadaceae bacterium]
MSPDWPSIRTETIERLQALIRFDTTNPPGNELPLARYLEKTLTGAGIETQLLVPAPNRAAVIARIRGDGSKRPVILLAHMDVVGVERANWSTDPFGGEIKDGFLYGRGAIDDKGMLAANLMTMLLLQREPKQNAGKLKRDVVFIATSDEEAGGDWGMGWLVENHPHLLDAEFALNEGGRTRVIAGNRTYLAVQSAEKISHVVKVTATGPAGHAAVPLRGNAIFTLARALEKLFRHEEPLFLTDITTGFFSRLAAIWPDATERRAMEDLVSGVPLRTESGARVLSQTAVFNAVIRNGVSPVMLEGGIRHNVIPATAAALLNVRTLPGQSLDAVISRMAHTAGDPAVSFEVIEKGVEAPASNPQSAMFEAIEDATRAIDPAIAVVPYLSTGVTDSARLRRLGVQAYGVLPFPMHQADEERMHGHDERVPLDSLEFGTRLIYGAVLRVAS